MSDSERHLEDLASIRSMMERSSRFISLSGLSGVFAGTFALIGAAAAYIYLDAGWRNYLAVIVSDGRVNVGVVTFLFLDAMAVLVASLSAGIFFTTRQARKKGQNIWDKVALRMLINLSIPLVTGGLFCILMFFHGYISLIAPATLIFYGLALLNASKYTLNDIRYLGISEILLGLTAGYFANFGLLFWSLGFGVLHIIYGLSMYFKYDR